MGGVLWGDIKDGDEGRCVQGLYCMLLYSISPEEGETISKQIKIVNKAYTVSSKG